MPDAIRIVTEVRRDVAAARSRDPAARDVGPLEILAAWPGVHALLAHRAAHALHDAGVPLLPRLIAYVSRAITGHRDPSRRQDRRRVLHRPRDGRRDRGDR